MFMVAFEQYTAAVAIRSALAAGQARFFCILIGVAIGTVFMLVLSSDRVGDVTKRCLKRIGDSELPRA
jgi:hypothetical protein